MIVLNIFLEFFYTIYTLLFFISTLLRTSWNVIRISTEETIPSLNGCEVIYVTVGETVACAINYQDDEETTDINFLNNDANASYVSSNRTVVYTQESSSPVDIK